ncbi:MAG: hypothetical protein HY973_00640 [Candidatus Kerfeldbacteria bacterium]|nr:hypothetical protein [Candidatus Kerfeldbacteria bacterium]
MKKVLGKKSTEKLTHFKCGVCAKWWAIGDAPDKKTWFCPWCGQKQKFKQDAKGCNCYYL